MTERFVNLTPHNVYVQVETDSEDLTAYRQNGVIFASGSVARVSTRNVRAGVVGGIPVFRQEYGAVVGLPDPEESVYYIVSAIVRTALPSRKDLVSPGDLVRNSAGEVVGCGSFISN
jgi:hypothetical protein